MSRMRFLLALCFTLSILPVLSNGQVLCAYTLRCQPGECNLAQNDRAATLKWDLSALTRDVADPLSQDYHIDEDGYSYFANVCGDCKANCDGRTGDAVRVKVDNSSDCAVLGVYLDSFSPIDAADPASGVRVMFTHGDGFDCTGMERTVRMSFQCDLVIETELYAAYHYGAGCDYAYDFKSNYGCPTITYDSPEPDDSLSGGSIFLIIFFVVAFVYVVVGMVYNKQKGKSGAELLPNYQFWTFTLPSLVKDGFRYTRDCITRRGGGTTEEYEEVRKGAAAGGGAAHTQSADL